MDRLFQDLRYALRQMRRQPGFATLSVVTLALGIGATTALFSVTETVLLEPLPYPDAERAAVLWSGWTDFPRTWVSYDEVEAYREEVESFDEVGMFMDGQANLTGGDAPERIRFAAVNANLFRILGVAPILGRGFLPEEDVPGGAPVVVLGHGLWQRRFAADPSVVGRTLEMNGTVRLVVGVMPSGFRLPLDFGADGPTEAWVPLAVDPEAFGAIPGPDMQENGGSHTFYALARLAPGATIERANAELDALTDRWNAEGVYLESWDFRATAVPVREEITGDVRPAIMVLLGAVGLLLLLACANVAGLFMVRGEERRRELGVRAALGAGGGRLLRQLLTESSVLAAAGGAAGLGIAWLGVQLITATAPASLPRIAGVGIDLPVVTFALVLTALATVTFGLLPALRARRLDPAESLREGGRGTTAGAARLRLRRWLVVGEVAAAVVLAVGAGLMVRTVGGLLAIDPGFESESALALEISVPSSDYPEAEAVVAFHDALRGEAGALPGVRAVGAARVLPLAAEIGNTGLEVEGYTPPEGEGSPGDWQVVTPGYMEAIGLELRTGRFLEERDRADAAPVMVVNRTLAETYLAGRDPIGGRIRMGFAGPDGPWFTVVGVVENVRHDGLTAPVRPKFYASYAQFARWAGFAPRTMNLVVRTSGEPTALAGPLTRTIRTLDPRIPLSGIRPLADVVANSIARPRFTMVLLVSFGVLALLLAAVGVYGVVAQAVASRRHELGIRHALGADAKDLIWLAGRGGLEQGLAGLGIGLAGAVALTRLMSGLVYGVQPLDLPTYAVVALLVLAVAAAATLVPARRAARVDPMTVLREE